MIRPNTFLPIALVCLLSACGDGSPSTADAEKAVAKYMGVSKVTIPDLDCAKSGTISFVCTFSVTAVDDSATPAGLDGQARYMFKKYGADWKIVSQ